MAHHIIKQPNSNGTLFALWSTNVDNFVLVNATKEEIIEHQLRQYRLALEDDFQRQLNYPIANRGWEAKLETVKELHGTKQLNNLLKIVESKVCSYV